MKELDFDELDRAVSSLMTDTSSLTSSPSDDPQERTLNLSEADATPAKPLFGSLDTDVVRSSITQSEPEIVPASLKPIPPAIRRSNGRFMDVVHSSSDMKQQSVSNSFPSRQGITVSPTPSSISNHVDILKPEEVKTAGFDKAVDDQDNTSSSDWPDPLDVPNQQQISGDSEPSTEALEPVEEEKRPLSSPFLADTKVEKRPLGSNNSVVSDEPSNTPVPDAAENQTIINPAEFETPLPEEFSKDLVAIESGESQPSTDDVDEDVPIENPAHEKPSEKPSVAETDKPTRALIPDHFPDEDVPKGPASIPQQYREQPNSGDQSNGSIYDTDTYHKPLSHPAKKQSGWLWVLWIILILAIGAGIGAGLYYFGIVK